ncbi:MAG: ROK family protein [Microbacteriaceae bacterium]
MADKTPGIESVRRANLGALLRLVHREGPRSRSALTAETGLNRSTIADLVTALAERGLVDEHGPDPTKRVGRPSPVVTANHDIVAIGINPEVDAIEIGAVGLGRQTRARARIDVVDVPTVMDAVAIAVDVITTWQRDELADCQLIGAGVAVPGLVRASDGLVRLAPHLGWRDEDIATPLADALGVPVTVDNDASLGAQAEYLFGAACEHRDVVYLNGGASGIGGGLIMDGTIIRGAGGYAGEWGQTRPGIANESHRRTHDGVFEDEVGRARLLAAAELVGGDDAALAAALTVGSGPTAHEEVARQRRVLAATISNAVNVLNPSMVVLGGFLGILRDQDPEGFDADVRERSLAVAAEELQIASAALGQDRLLIGAAEAAFAPLLADPLG